MTAEPRTDEATLTELQRLSDEATPGPWSNNGNGIHTSRGECIALSHFDDKVQRHADAAFIGALVNAFRAGDLVSSEVLRGQADALQAATEERDRLQRQSTDRAYQVIEADAALQRVREAVEQLRLDVCAEDYPLGAFKHVERLRAALGSGDTQPDTGPTFDQLLSDPTEQFDPKSELLPHIVRYLGLPPTADVSALMASIEEYRNAPSCTASAPVGDALGLSLVQPSENPEDTE